jgi:fatty acid desaturase
MKAKKIASLVLMGLPLLLLVVSSFFKFISAPQVVEGLTKIGFLPSFPLMGLALLEIGCVITFLIPKTWRIGFFLVCGYLGGAASIEIAGHQPPMALVLLTLFWVGVFLKDSTLFFGTEK